MTNERRYQILVGVIRNGGVIEVPTLQEAREFVAKYTHRPKFFTGHLVRDGYPPRFCVGLSETVIQRWYQQKETEQA